MNKFHYSRTYTFDAPKGWRKHYFFNLAERHGFNAKFRLNDKDNTDTIDGDIVRDGETDHFTLLSNGEIEYPSA